MTSRAPNGLKKPPKRPKWAPNGPKWPGGQFLGHFIPILGHSPIFDPFWPILTHFGPFWAILDPFWAPFWTFSDSFEAPSKIEFLFLDIFFETSTYETFNPISQKKNRLFF